MNKQWDEEAKGDAEMEINSKQANPGFQPPYKEPAIGGEDIDMGLFMNHAERERAMTYYQQVKDEAEERACKFCDKQITDADEKSENKTMI